MTFARIAISLLLITTAGAQTCKFKLSGTTMALQNDCWVTTAISIPNGFTLNGNHHLMTVIDPSNGQLFSGPIVTNVGPVASVINLIIDTPQLKSCSVVEGISFNSTTGSIAGNSILHIGQTAQSCSTARPGIELINPVNVTISRNRVWSSNGPALSVTCPEWPTCSGGGTVTITDNEFTTSQDQTVVQMSGVGGAFTNNLVDNYFIYNIALYLSNLLPGFKVTSNNINSEQGATTGSGIYVASDGVVITGNKIFNWGISESGAIGINNVGLTNSAPNKITNNVIRCYGIPAVNVAAGSNVVLSCPF